MIRTTFGEFSSQCWGPRIYLLYAGCLIPTFGAFFYHAGCLAVRSLEKLVLHRWVKHLKKSLHTAGRSKKF